MGSDVLCAVCGGPTVNVQIAEKSRKGRPEGSDDSDDQAYDPSVVTMEDVEWTNSCILLGFNPQAVAIDKRMYWTGPAQYDDYGCFRVDVGHSENVSFPNESDEFQCYQVYDATQTSCYPIHPPCLALFTNLLWGDSNIENFDKDVLYHVMSSHSSYAFLDLDYGDPHPGYEQYWWSRPGEEVLAINPTTTPAFTAFLPVAVSNTDFTLPTPLVIEAGRIREDPFSSLPYDIAHAILLLLPPPSVLALCNASYPIHAFFSPSNHLFWRAALHACMPWFWELHTLMADDSALNTEKTKYKGLFLWLDSMTTSRRWLEGPFMKIANRRRIWYACEQLAARYVPMANAKITERAAGALIWDNSVNVDLSAVVWPMPEKGLRSATGQLASDLVNISTGGALGAIWSADGSLAGIEFTVAGERNVFGMDASASKDMVMVESEITGFVLHMPDMFLREKVETSVKGITVLTSTKEYHLGEMNPHYCQRIFSVIPNHTLTGIVGHVTSDGQIARLGLAVHSFGDDKEDELAPPLLHRRLWKAPTSSTSALHTAAAPIWSHHPRLRALPSSTRALRRYSIQSMYHDDVVPTDVFIWGADAHELRSVRRIAAYQPGDGRHVGALRVEFSPESGLAARTVGEEAGRRLLGAENFNPVWDGSGTDDSWVPFEIDGAGGEMVVAVEVAHDEDIQAVMLRTNRGREVLWGKKPSNEGMFEAMEPAEGEFIVGLAVGFMYPIYRTSNQYHLQMSSMAALVMAL
ncbi:hypothetical protein C8J57DRAFT_490239 [Mycena rebaudengoi]|nr:hypothetical protein C8J57DRAFT_490239 [Mycena rebaudengoi]